jgi:hypothetical protein
MSLATRLAALAFLSSALSFAETWSGALVDARCYLNEERNVNPTDTLTDSDRDTAHEIRYCSPNAKTRSFSLVQREGPSFTLDSAGNAKAAELVRQTGKKSLFLVSISGELRQKSILVDSISVEQTTRKPASK